MNFYEILELKNTATADEIKTAYKRLARKWHPDKNNGRDTTKKFQEIAEAYEVLSNPVSRRRYDNFEFSSQSQPFTNSKSKNHSQKAPSVNKAENYPKSKHSEIPKPFDWKTFIWKNSQVQEKITALKAFAQEVNTRPTKGSFLPAWIEFESEVHICGECKFPPDNNGPYITLELREIFGKAKAKVPVKLPSLLQYCDSRNHTILGRIISGITRILILTLLPEKTRFSLLWPSDTLFEDSPLRVHLRNCHQSWNCGSALIELLSLLPSKQQILICKNYFESIGLEATKKLNDKLQSKQNEFKKYSSELRLCTAMGQLMYYKDVLEKESQQSTDKKLKEKREILSSVLEQINFQEASFVILSNALDRLENLQVLKEPRNWWDPRLPKSYTFFNSFKVAVETLARPRVPSSQRVFLQTEELRDLNSNFHWDKLSNAKKEEFLSRFQTHVNKNTPPNERLLLPQSLEFCRYSFGHSNPAWKIINPANSDKPAMVQIYYSETCKTGKTIKHRGFVWEEEKKTDRKLTFNLNLNHLLQYRSDVGRDFFTDRFDLVLEHIPENQRLPLLMERDNFGQTKLKQVFLNDQTTVQRLLQLLPIREQLMAVHQMALEIKNKKLSSYLDKNVSDTSELKLFKIMQKLTQYQALLEKEVINNPTDLLVFEKFKLLKSVLEKIQDPEHSMESIQNYLAGILNKKSAVLQTRRHWFNPSTPKTYSYLHELKNFFDACPNLKTVATII